MSNRSLEILDIRVYRGPNQHSYSKGISIQVDIADLEDEPSMKISGFNEKLLKLLPTLYDHTCSYNTKGGFVRRLTEDEGTWMGHIFEHLAIEIQNLAGVPVSRGKTRQVKGKIGRSGKNSVYHVYFEYRNEETALAASNLAARIVNYLIDPEQAQGFNFEKELVSVIEIAEEYAYGPSTGAIVKEATSRDIPSIRLRKSSSLVQFGWGKNQKRIWASTSTKTGYISVEIAQDKELTLQMLFDVGIPVPRGGTARSYQDVLFQIDRIGYPVVIKPLDVSHGRGITINITNKAELKTAFELAKEYAGTIIVERFLEGKDYRILVIDGKFVAAANRVPAHIIGDGKNTITQLIEIVNSDPRRGVGHEKVLTQITINDNTKRLLAKQNLTLDGIPEKDCFVQLKSTANLSTGGTAVDVTDIIHYENILLAERAVKTLGLDIAGVDIITNDISKSIKTHGGGIVEINAAPGLRMHLEPTEGTPRNVAKHIIDMLFSEGSDGRIPLIAVTGTNGKTTTSRWISHTLKLAGYKVGLATTDGIYIDGILEFAGDTTGPWSAKVVLRDPKVDFAVLETARGGILREGLGWDFCDVGILLNVSDDHLGLRGIETVEELADIKGVVLDQVSTTGMGVINVDDPLVLKQKERIDGEIAMVSLDYQNQHFLNHVKSGGLGVTITPNGIIQLWKGRSQTPIAHVREIPATFRGKAVFNVQNAMFMVAAVSRFINVNDIYTGLTTFYTDRNQTPGRMNLERIKGARVLIDYGHNAEAFRVQCEFVQNLFEGQGKKGRKGIVFGLPGDRRDVSLRNAVKEIAGQYDRYFVKEDWHPRGRKPGEIIDLITSELIQNGVAVDQIKTYGNGKTELDAVKAMYDWLEPHDIVILQADDINKVQDYLLKTLVGASDLRFLNIKREIVEPEEQIYNFTKNIKIIEDDFSD